MKIVRLSALGFGIFGLLAWNSQGQVTGGFLTNGLIAYYPLNGESQAQDASGNGNDGILGSSVTFVPDRFGISNGAALFVGDSGSYVALNTTSFNLQPDLTISAWVKFTTSYGNNGPRVFSASGYEMTLYAPDNNYALTNRGAQFAGGAITTADLYANEWIHLVGIISNTTTLVFTNGVFAGSGAITEPINYALSDAAIGHSCVLSYSIDAFGGSIADVRVYNRALSTEEIGELYESFALGIVTLPTITISGSTNQTYSIQYVTTLGSTNWQTLVSNIVLQTNLYFYTDTNAINQPRRYYRAVAQ